MELLKSTLRIVEKHGDIDDIHENKKFFHYCDLTAANNILQSKNVWATYIKHSNDKSEFKHGMDMFKNYISSLSNKHFSFNLVKQLDEYFNNQILSPSIKPYIFCFSENGDQLSQWRGYANSGNGVSLGFKINRSKGYHLVKKVIYSDREKLNKIAEIIAEFDNEINKIYAEILKMDQKPQEEAIRFITASLMQLIVTTSCFFKDQTFEEEKEWRIVYFKPGAGNTKFRVSGGNLINYIEQQCQITYTDLIFGPKVSLISKESLATIANNIPDKIELADSKIPFQ